MDALLTRTTLGMDPMDGKERKQETTEEEANLGRRPTASANPHGLVCWAAIINCHKWVALTVDFFLKLFILYWCVAN